MLVWLVNPFEPLPGEGFALLRYRALARELARRGHEVVWWSCGFFHFGKRRRERPPVPSAEDPYEVRLVPAIPYRSHASPVRLLSHAGLAAATLAAMLREARRPGLVLASIPPLELPAAMAGLAGRLDVPLCIDVTDCWPDTFRFLLRGPARRLAPLVLAPHGALAARALGACSAVSAVSATYLRWAQARGGDGKPAAFIPWAVPLPPAPVCREGPSSPLRAVFCGTLGLTYDIELILAAADLLERRHPGLAEFDVVGAGPRLAGIRGRRLSRTVHVQGPMDHAELSALLGRSDVGLCCYARGAPQSLTIKLYTYLAHGLPVASTLPGEMRELLDGGGMGRTVSGPEELAGYLLDLVREPGLWRTQSRSARGHAEENDLSLQTRRLAGFVLAAAGAISA